MSLVFVRTIMAMVKHIHSAVMSTMVVTGSLRMCGVVLSGQNSSTPAPVKKSPIRLCWIRAMKYGTACFL